jgi:hypothetical protein
MEGRAPLVSSGAVPRSGLEAMVQDVLGRWHLDALDAETTRCLGEVLAKQVMLAEVRLAAAYSGHGGGRGGGQGGARG